MTQQRDTATEKSSVFQTGTRLPRVRSQLAKAARLLLAVPEPEEMLSSKSPGIPAQVKGCACHIHTAWGQLGAQAGGAGVPLSRAVLQQAQIRRCRSKN